jgi:hypothetical protein
MRTVLIRIKGAKRCPIRKLQLHEGTRVSDILQTLNVPAGYILARASNPTRPFPQEAEAHALVADADYLYLIVRSPLAPVESITPFTLTLST